MILTVNKNITNVKNCNSQNFKGENDNYAIPISSYNVDKFIKDVDKSVELQKKGNIFTRYIWSTTALIPAAMLVLPYEFHNLYKLNKLKKAGEIELLKVGKQSFRKTFPWLCSGAVALYAGLEYLFSRNFDKKYEKYKQDFERINTSTDAKLADYTVNANVMGAMCSPISGNVVINRNILRDPISSRRAIKLLKHELVHAKQYETIARSENGIKKLNYAVMKSSSRSVDTPQGRNEVTLIYSDIINDKSGKYDNLNLSVLGAEVNLKNYITALYVLLNDEKCGIDDIPMVIDEKHYQNVVDKKGKLSQQEEIKAEQYYQAQLSYPLATPLKMLNPFSDYYDNLLEKEAYKESPNFMTFIRKICGKN